MVAFIVDAHGCLFATCWKTRNKKHLFLLLFLTLQFQFVTCPYLPSYKMIYNPRNNSALHVIIPYTFLQHIFMFHNEILFLEAR